LPSLCEGCAPARFTNITRSHVSSSHLPGADVEKLSNAKNLTEPEKKALAREMLDYSRDGRETTIFPADVSIDDILKNVKPDRFVEGNSAVENHRLFRGQVELAGTPSKTYEVDIVLCMQLSCEDGLYHHGDVITVFPRCGPGVAKIPRSSTLNAYLEGKMGWSNTGLKLIPCK
jgi:hypothetical protein